MRLHRREKFLALLASPLLYNLLFREFICLSAHQQPNDQSKKAQHTREDLNHKHFHEECCICRICKRRAAAVDAHTDTTDQIAHSDRQTGPKEGVASVVVGACVELVFGDHLDQRGKDDRHNDTVDGDDFAEDDGDEVLRSYSWSFDAASEDGCAGDEDAPAFQCQLLRYCKSFSIFS